ncbi:MAG: 2-isopropylmalate synthase [Treponemataceae bacterium]
MRKYVASPVVKMQKRMWPDAVISKAPRWCSVDLRDGNQALIDPMGIEAKLAMFEMLVKIGFKEIEIGFPSASQIEFDFARRLFDENRVPADVAVQVLCQAREHLVERTMESLKGAKKAVFHIYNSVSPAQRKYTFNMTKDEIKAVAINGIRMVKDRLPMIQGTDVMLEYSPESFSQTEIDYALEVCEAVMDEWGPTPERPMILNLPATVECSTPNVHADQIEWFCTHLKRRSSAIISLHTHNDRGTGIAAAELGVLAGADRIEGTLFGNGERTGNLDIVAMSLNMYTQGIDTKLDFSNLPAIVDAYENMTGMFVHARHPYAGELVYTAFSGSHQDAIKKALDARAAAGGESVWDVPYLPIDPKDVGRSYEAIIRINSQSGKGGVAYIMREKYGFDLPKAMHAEIGTIVNKKADTVGRELKSEEILDVFTHEYLEQKGRLHLDSIRETSNDKETKKSTWEAHVIVDGVSRLVSAVGSGPIEAFVKALKSIGINGFEVTAFHEDALTRGADSSAVAYVQVERKDGKRFWGVGIDPSIADSGVRAVVSVVNRMGL